MTARDVLGLVVVSAFAVVGLGSLRRALPPIAWEALLVALACVALVLAAAFAPELDAAVLPLDVAGVP